MKTKEIKWHSKYLAKDMPIKIYGSDCGKPVIVFPTQSGSYLDYENFGMIDACQQFINSNKIQLYCIQTIDSDSWCNQSITPKRRAEVNELFNNYVMNELIPFIGKGNIGLTGCSMGAYYSANFYFRYPKCFDLAVCLSPILKLNCFIDDYIDKNVFNNTPLCYVKANKLYDNSKIIFCCGQDSSEKLMYDDLHQMQKICFRNKIPTWFDFWGTDVTHTWYWWRKQIVYYLSEYILQSAYDNIG